jgi:type IX secretion system PorP/SprF family membrane protein
LARKASDIITNGLKAVFSNKKTLMSLLLFATFWNVAFAQDPHFSQFYASPLTLNPANTGLFAGDARVATNYRNQWRTVATPFTTATVACDVQLLNDKIGNDLFGFGMVGMLDQSNNQGLKANFLGLSTAYNKSIDRRGYHRVGVGLQASLVSKKVDYSRFVFSRQFTPMGFDPTASNGEPISGFTLNYLDLAAGFIYSGINEAQSQWYLGASMYHINRPNEAINPAENNLLEPRLSCHGGLNFQLGELNRIYFSGLYMNSAITEELMAGAVFESTIRNYQYDTKLFSGMYYRVGDAIIPYIGINTGQMSVGFSYDINVSSLKTATQSRGGFEIALQLNLSKNNENNKIPGCYNRF